MARYPFAMRHPNAKASKPQAERGVDSGSGRGFVDYHGSPDMFAPVTVNNNVQEAEHRAKGYVGMDEPFPEAGDYIEYPKWMNHPQHEPVLINDPSQQKEAEDRGYFEPGRPDPDAVEAASAAPYVPGRHTAEWPKMVDGVLMQGPDAEDDGPVQYPKALTPPGGGEQVFVNSAAEEKVMFQKWGVGLPKSATTPHAPVTDAAIVYEAPSDPVSGVPGSAKSAKTSRSEAQKASWAKRKAAKAQGAAA